MLNEYVADALYNCKLFFFICFTIFSICVSFSYDNHNNLLDLFSKKKKRYLAMGKKKVRSATMFSVLLLIIYYLKF